MAEETPRKYMVNSDPRKDDRRQRARIVLCLIIFLVGVCIGIAGLCAAVKFIFYVGLAVTVAAAFAIVIGIFVAKNKIEKRISDRSDGTAD